MENAGRYLWILLYILDQYRLRGQYFGWKCSSGNRAMGKPDSSTFMAVVYSCLLVKLSGNTAKISNDAEKRKQMDRLSAVPISVCVCRNNGIDHIYKLKLC